MEIASHRAHQKIEMTSKLKYHNLRRILPRKVRKDWLSVLGGIAGIVALIITVQIILSEKEGLKNKIDVSELETRILRDENAELKTRIKELEDRLFQPLSEQVMESDVPLSQIKSPIPLKLAGSVVDSLKLLVPENNSVVPSVFYVHGVFPDPSKDLWIIIHAMRTGEYHVKAKATVWQDSSWTAKISTEQTENLNVGEQFELRAIANPRISMRKRDILSKWPEAQWNSQIIHLVISN